MSPTPSNPVNISSPRLGFIDNRDNPSVFPSPVSTPDVRGVIRAQYTGTPPPPNIPPRVLSTVTPGTSSPSIPIISTASSSPNPRRVSVGGISAHRPGGTGTPASNTDQVDLDDLPDEEKAKVLRRHLVRKDERQNGLEGRSHTGSSANLSQAVDEALSRKSSLGTLPVATPNAPEHEDLDTFPIHYHAPGADVTHDIYKWQSDQRKLSTRPRSASYAGSHPAPPNPAFEHIHEPGGFRRNYVLLKATEQGTEEPRILKNFIDFLYLFGHFAGEDLEEDEDDKEDEEAATGADQIDSGLSAAEIAERQPLLRQETSRSRSRSRRRRMSVGPHGDATVTQAVLMLLKSFIGTGVLFLGKAFYNGGILFSAVTIVLIALISLFSFLLLVKTKFVVSGSFGDIGGALYGPWMRFAILTSITVSQIGFVAAYTIFVAENLQAFVMAITNCIKLISVPTFILIQLVIFLPLAMIRNLAKLSTTALVADVFIFAGLIYIFGSEAAVIAREGVADVRLFNAKDFPLFIGTAVFSFEGIGLVIPITDSMREPRKFPKVLTGVMLFLTVLFGGAGVLSYSAFGSNIQTVVIVNLDAESKSVQTVQFLYSLAILLSVPLQLFPAVRIMENGLFTRSGKANPRVKWLKNAFRLAVVLGCTAISWAGAADLDKFVAFIGCFACVPLCYIYPPMLHYKACARTLKQKSADIALFLFGCTVTVYTTIQTVRLMIEPGNATSPKFGKCDVSAP